MAEDFGVNQNINGNFQDLAKEMRISVENEFVTRSQEIFQRLKEQNPNWQLSVNSNKQSVRLSAPEDALTKEFGTFSTSGNYRVNRTIKSIFGDAVQYDPTNDHQQHRNALKRSDPNTIKKGLLERQASPERQENPRREKIKADLRMKALMLEAYQREQLWADKLLSEELYSPFQNRVKNLLVEKAQRAGERLGYRNAGTIEKLVKKLPRKYASYKEKLFMGLLLRELRGLPKDHLPSEQQLESIIFTVNQYSIVDGPVKRVGNRSILDSRGVSRKDTSYKPIVSRDHLGRRLVSSRFDRNSAALDNERANTLYSRLRKKKDE